MIVNYNRIPYMYQNIENSYYDIFTRVMIVFEQRENTS